jgi:hypothetical protein
MTKKYFVYDPASEGFVTFETKEEQKEYAAECIKACRGEEWDENAEDIVCGVITHTAQAVNVQRVPKLDADGYDEEGGWWGVERDGGETCEYEMVGHLLLLG